MSGAIKRIRIIGNGGRFYVQADTINGAVTASILRGAVKTWCTLDGTAKWLHSLGLGKAHLDFAQWRPGQKVMKYNPKNVLRVISHLQKKRAQKEQKSQGLKKAPAKPSKT